MSAYLLPQFRTGQAPVAQHYRRREDGQGRILVVDDDPQTLRYVRDVLTRAGYEPIVTGDPEEVLT